MNMIPFVALWALYGFAVLRLGPRLKFVRYLPMAVGGLIATAPIWSLALMMLLWSGTSCTVDASGPNPCSLLGVDFGAPLYFIGNLATWGFFFLPILAIAGAIYVVIHLPFFLVALRR